MTVKCDFRIENNLGLGFWNSHALTFEEGGRKRKGKKKSGVEGWGRRWSCYNGKETKDSNAPGVCANVTSRTNLLVAGPSSVTWPATFYLTSNPSDMRPMSMPCTEVMKVLPEEHIGSKCTNQFFWVSSFRTSFLCFLSKLGRSISRQIPFCRSLIERFPPWFLSK